MASDNQEIFLSVSDLNQLARLTLERSLPSCRVQGELSNFMRAASGHWYFTLKDDQASVRCVMFKTRNQFVEHSPRDGDHVEIRAQPTLYEPRGDFQLLVDAMRPAGQGALYEAFLRLKAKLEAEGLFAGEHKQPLPPMPRSIGVITSPRAAALRDVLTTIEARWPASRIVLYPCQVQGEAAPGSVVEALRQAGTRLECEVLLLVRGGGSLEDLMGFNNEAVARAIHACPIPIIAGIGHETDFTIADFVADLRAPTPSGAAQLATPSKLEMQHRRLQLATRLTQTQLRKLHSLGQTLDGLARRVVHPSARLASRLQQLRHNTLRLNMATRIRWQSAMERYRRCILPPPATLIQVRRETLAQRMNQLQAYLGSRMAEQKQTLQVNQARLELLNPEAVLARGYSIVTNEDHQIIRDASKVVVGESLLITLSKGSLEALSRKVIPGRSDRCATREDL